MSDILDIAKVETGNIRLEPSDVQLRLLLVEQAEAIRALAEARGLAVEIVECGEGIMVRADPRRLSQVVRNLLSNSVMYTDHGAVRVRACENSGNVVVEFEDTGIGMSAEETRRLFTPFRRSDNPPSAARGSRFSVTLPLAAVDQHRAGP